LAQQQRQSAAQTHAREIEIQHTIEEARCTAAAVAFAIADADITPITSRGITTISSIATVPRRPAPQENVFSIDYYTTLPSNTHD
jgi:hypothetical protein